MTIPGAGGARGSLDHATLHAPQSGRDRGSNQAPGSASTRSRAWRHCGDGRSLIGKSNDDKELVAEAPGSRTQPPRVSGGRPILKTGRATGPRSLPSGPLSPMRESGHDAGPQLDASASEIKPLPSRPLSQLGNRSSDQTARGESSGLVRHRGSALEELNVAGPRSLPGFLRREVHALTFPEELEHRASHGTPVKKVFYSAFIANEAKALVDEQTRDRTSWHTLSSVVAKRPPDPQGISLRFGLRCGGEMTGATTQMPTSLRTLRPQPQAMDPRPARPQSTCAGSPDGLVV